MLKMSAVTDIQKDTQRTLVGTVKSTNELAWVVGITVGDLLPHSTCTAHLPSVNYSCSFQP